jgi:hypothetical protein
MTTAFDYEAHKPYTQAGIYTVKGQGFMRQSGGGVVTCAGSEVVLMPATPFFREVIDIHRAWGTPQIEKKLDSSYKSIVKQSQCDAQGNFSFTHIPAGSWFVMTHVQWMAGYTPQGGTLLREVTVTSADVQVLLTGNDFVGG